MEQLALCFSLTITGFWWEVFVQEKRWNLFQYPGYLTAKLNFMGYFSSSQNCEHLDRILFHPWLLRTISHCELCEIPLFQRPLKTATALYCDPSGSLHIFPVLIIFHSCCFHFLLASAMSSFVPHAFFCWTHQTLDYYYSNMLLFPAHMLRFIKWA